MKLSTAIEQGLVKEGDEIEVSFKAKLIKIDNEKYYGDCFGLLLTYKMDELEGNYTVFNKKDSEVIDCVNLVPEQSSSTETLTEFNESVSDVGKTFKLCEAKEHLKVGMKVKIVSPRGETYLRTDVWEITEVTDRGFSGKPTDEQFGATDDFYYSNRRDCECMITILSDPTGKDSLQAKIKKLNEEPLPSNFCLQLQKRIEKIESLIGETEAGIEDERSIHERLEAMEDYASSSDYELKYLRDFFYGDDTREGITQRMEKFSLLERDRFERICVLEDQVQKLKKQNESLFLRIGMLEQMMNNYQPLQPTPTYPTYPSYPFPRPMPLPSFPVINQNVTSVYSAPMEQAIKNKGDT